MPIGLSSDVATTAPSDQFTQMRSILGSERGRKHQEAWDANLDGLEASPGLITSRQVLEWATLGGAKVAGIADRTGSITPGKQADLVIIDGSAVNVAPIIDPVGAVVCAADVSNVRTVLVGGNVVKDDFRLKASLDAPRKDVEASAATTCSGSSAIPSRAGSCRPDPRPQRHESPASAGLSALRGRPRLQSIRIDARRTSPGSRIARPVRAASASPPASAFGQAVCGSTQKAWGGV